MIYFYGGAFNPMTISHLEIIKSILKDLKEDEKLVIGITEHDYKTYDLDFELRKMIVMNNLMAIDADYALGKTIQILKQNQRTWKFFHTLPYQDITMVVGEDEWNDLKEGKWHYSKEILNTYKIKVIPRVDNISATKVRELIKNKASKEELLKYITKETYSLLFKE